MHQRAWQGCRLASVDAKCDLALYDIERFIPRMVMRRRAAAFGSPLQEYFIAAGLRAGGEHGDLFADNL